ncbi:MAG: hypothetical protein JJ866_10130 [Roseibium sp.]|uniref:hypothetical protein n=1 Tax=Roseibium sp. TaxID=1936156 RepID=UPI001B0C2736|nr:hypothetical protein [Roseibium sp.]MBO6892285.1 hypothetical protein [Roseibium sp.]MBO6929890.1 hypothetical protein [Roseibium sp.]
MSGALSKDDFPTPSEFMRGRRPEQFSDSHIDENFELDAGFLEYKLESITSRSEEKQFEHLARRLAERLICPNLIPQTGPTGGGDSKVDTETYPVHEDISSRWYEGNVEAANERWGFAVSAMKQWQGKLRSDMASIASTGRGYRVAYFVSNQFISDKTKSKFQDELSKEYGFEVRILDRTWLMEAIIEKGNEDIAARALNLSNFTTSKRIGPNDLSKQEALDELEKEISDTGRYQGVEYQLVEDCISAAIISRELELDRYTTEGRHERAIRLAREHGTERQIASALYQKAWTAVYWHDDFGVLLGVYDEIEAFSLCSRNSSDIEKAINLWQTLHTVVISEAHSLEETKLVDRANRLIHHLEELSGEADRPNNAANSKWLKLGMQIVQHAADESQRDKLLREFGDLLVGSQHLGGFEFNRAYELFEVLGAPFGELEVYDEVFEQVLPVYQERHSDVAVADKLFNRGIDKLRTDKVISGIDLLGRALPKLIKAEKKERMVRCLAALASAYSSMDLFWAAYANHMSALSILIQDFGDTREIDPLLPMLLEKMFWGEISTGRIPHALWCLELQISTLRQTGLDEEDEGFQEDYRLKGGVLAMLLLKADASQLNEFTGLVDFFEQSGLIACSLALLFAFGGPDYLRKHEYVPESESDTEIWETMKRLWDQPAQDNLPERIDTFGGKSVSLISRLLGTRWEIVCQHNPWCVRIGESYIGFLEAFLATSLSHQAVGTMERAKMRFELASEGEACPNELGLELRPRSGSELATVVIWPEKFPLGSLRTDKLRDFFVYSLVNILPKILFPKDTKAFLDVVAGSEEGLPRSLMFADVLASSSNIFDDCRSPSLSDWAGEGESYEIVVDPPSNLALQSIMSLRQQKKKEEMKFGEDEPPDDFLEDTPLKHGAYQTLSVVDIELWQEAGWEGVGVALQPDLPNAPPFLGLLFRNGEAGRRIFENWISDIGRVDSNEKIRIVILTGVEKSNPNAYTLAVSSNIDKAQFNELDRIFVTSKMKTMDNPDPRNLENFGRAFAASRRYALVPVTLSDDGRPPDFHFDLSVLKREVAIREAWTVGLNDPDGMAVSPSIDPIIPKGQDNAPILESIEWQKNRGR